MGETLIIFKYGNDMALVGIYRQVDKATMYVVLCIMNDDMEERGGERS